VSEPDDKSKRLTKFSAEREARPGEDIERQQQLARVEDRYPETEQCAACAESRRASGDPTDLCKEHLRRLYGI
jgi:hypothetical protein